MATRLEEGRSPRKVPAAAGLADGAADGGNPANAAGDSSTVGDHPSADSEPSAPWRINGRPRRPVRWICRLCQRRFSGRAMPIHEHTQLAPLCAYRLCDQVVRYAGRACCDEHAIRATRLVMKLSDSMVGSGPQTGLSLFAARRGRFSRAELAKQLGVDWRRLYWIEVYDDDYSKEKWVKKLDSLLGPPAPEPPGEPDPLDAVLDEGLSDLQRVVSARKILSRPQMVALVTQFASQFLDRTHRIVGSAKS